MRPLLATLIGLTFWSAMAWLAVPRIGLEPWAGYAFGLCCVMVKHNLQAARDARRLPTFDKAQ